MEPANDAGSKNWLKERAAISAAHRRQKTDPAASRLIEKADQLHKERTQRNLRETAEEDDEARDEFPEPAAKNEGRDRRTNVKSSFRRSVLFSSPLNYSSTPADEDELEDIDNFTSVPPPEEIVVKVSQKPAVEDTIVSNHGKETSEDVYRSFAESVLEQGLTIESSLELSFDLKPEDIKTNVEEEVEDEEDEEGEEGEEGEEEEEEHKEEKEENEENEENEEKEDNQEEQADADADEAYNAEEKVQKESEYTDAVVNHNEKVNHHKEETNHNEEINDEQEEISNKKEESTLTEGVTSNDND